MQNLEHWATIVSIVPLEIHEHKPRCTPSYVDIKAAKPGDMELFHVTVGESAYYIDHERGSLNLPVMAEKIADGVVQDYCRASILHTEDAYPGIFWVPGKLDKKQIELLHKDKLAKAREVQDRWCNILVRSADDSWRKHRQNNLISDVQRAAAKYLGVKREWTEEVDPRQSIECKFCTSLIPARAIICPVCHQTLNQQALVEARG